MSPRAETSPPTAEIRAFLIADVRGYTRFTVEHGSQAGALLAKRFADIAVELVLVHGGNVTELRGDEALAVFASPRAALQAAVALQQRFRAEAEIDPSLPLRVGIGVDVGEAYQVHGGFRGQALNLAARLCSLAGPGEVFSSELVVQMAERIEGLAYVERGRVQLKGFEDPIRIIHVLQEADLPENFPPLVSLVAKPHNLPLQPTPFIGRDREIEEISRLLVDDETRLLTLTGPGGTGKTRLALQVANEILDHFDYGVFLVSLASLADAQLVPATIASTLHVKEPPNQSIVQGLIDYLRDREMLLMLDNFEHLLPAAEQVASLLSACSKLKVLVTSRSVLHLMEERTYEVPPLAVPDLREMPGLEAISQYDAVAFFIERAQSIKPAFAITNENAPAVAEICFRLDGLPLAIELAVARLRIFPPRTLLTQLSNRLKLLTGGPRNLPGRQQTLRRTIDWSYGLLTAEEQAVFARLSVFAGGCTFAAAQAVSGPDGEYQLLDALQSLVEQSMVREHGDDDPRFQMLETIREYAAEKLHETGETDNIRRRHAEYYAGFVNENASDLTGPRQAEVYRLLEADVDNLRAASVWAREQVEPDLGLRILADTTSFWIDRGHMLELQKRIRELLESRGAIEPSVRVRALESAGLVALFRQDLPEGQRNMEEALALARAIGDPILLARQLSGLGTASYYQGELERGEALQQEALALAQQTGNPAGEALAVFMLAAIASLAGNLDQARTLGEHGLEMFRRQGDAMFSTLATLNLSQTAIRQGHTERARGLLRESLDGASQLESLRCLIAGVEFVAGLAVTEGDAGSAALLLGAAEVARAPTGEPISPDDIRLVEHTIETSRARLGPIEWERLLGEGRKMTLERAVAKAGAYLAEPAPPDAVDE